MPMHTHSPDRKPAMPRIARWVFWAFAGISAFYLITEHTAHTFYLLPFLLLAACPLLHLGMHRSHGHGGNAPRDQEHAGHKPSEPEDRP